MPVLTHPPLAPDAQAIVNHSKGLGLVVDAAKSAGLPIPEFACIYEWRVTLHFRSLADLAQWVYWAETQVKTERHRDTLHHFAECDLMELPVRMTFIEQVTA